jgi:hypothetical protein
MSDKQVWRGFMSVVLVLTACGGLRGTVGSAQSSDSQQGLEASELQGVEKAKTPEEKIKICLNIAGERLKIIDSATRRENEQDLTKAVAGFRVALEKAEDVLSQEPATKPGFRKIAEPMLRTIRKYGASLLEILKKSPEDLRKHIQAAMETAERISDGLALQLEKSSKK